MSKVYKSDSTGNTELIVGPNITANDVLTYTGGTIYDNFGS